MFGRAGYRTPKTLVDRKLKNTNSIHRLSRMTPFTLTGPSPTTHTHTPQPRALSNLCQPETHGENQSAAGSHDHGNSAERAEPSQLCLCMLGVTQTREAKTLWASKVPFYSFQSEKRILSKPIGSGSTDTTKMFSEIKLGTEFWVSTLGKIKSTISINSHTCRKESRFFISLSCPFFLSLASDWHQLAETKWQMQTEWWQSKYRNLTTIPRVLMLKHPNYHSRVQELTLFLNTFSFFLRYSILSSKLSLYTREKSNLSRKTLSRFLPPCQNFWPTWGEPFPYLPALATLSRKWE